MDISRILLVLILMFYVSALTSFVLSVAVFSMAGRVRANLWILAMILGIFVLSWLRLAI